MHSLEIANLSKKYGKLTALSDVNLNVEEGEAFGYIGPNGSGKTTTIRVVLGILQPTSGKATVFGMDSWKDAVSIHKRIAYVPGDVSLWPGLTGGEVLDLFVSLRGKINIPLREKLLNDFQLDPSKKCRTYSKGNRQKVALVAAFASDADMYIFDEPTSGLDPLMAQVFFHYVRDQKNRGKSIFLSSHVLSEVERLCDRVGIIREGKLVEVGTLSQLRHLTRVTMYVSTNKPLVGLEELAGVSGIRQQQEGVSFQVDADSIGSVVSYLSPHEVNKLECMPPTLEELFMRHYSADGNA